MASLVEINFQNFEVTVEEESLANLALLQRHGKYMGFPFGGRSE